MPPELSRASGLIGSLCLSVLLWGLSIGVVYWDLKRRALPRAQEIAWLALAALLPGLGLLAYLFSKLLNKGFPVPYTGAFPDSSKRRATLLKQAPSAAPRTGTISASDLVKDTVYKRPHVAADAIPPSVAAPAAVVPIASVSVPVKLSAVAGPHAGQEFLVEALPARIGRGGEASLRLDLDLGVSRQHAEFYRQDTALRIRDLTSVHGTSVNGVSIHDKALAIGDKIEVGLSTLVVKDTGP